MEFSFVPFQAELRHRFTVAAMSRTHTPLVLVRLTHAGATGYGEASMPPYLGESQDSVIQFLDLVKQSNIFKNLNSKYIDIQYFTKKINAISEKNMAAKAAIDMALHDWKGNLEGQSVWKNLDSEPQNMPITSCTIGMDTPPVLRQKVAEAADFQVLKIKMGAAEGISEDRNSLTTIRSVTDKKLYVDANAGWKIKEAALDFIHEIAEMGVQIVEQPMEKTDLRSHEWLAARSPLPIFADESFQRITDVENVKHAFHGVNIKLMKCGGLSEADQIERLARANGLRVMLGCMTETSCAIMAAAQLAPRCDFVDLDGPWLFANNPFETPTLNNGKIQLSEHSGFGLQLKTPIFG